MIIIGSLIIYLQIKHYFQLAKTPNMKSIKALLQFDYSIKLNKQLTSAERNKIIMMKVNSVAILYLLFYVTVSLTAQTVHRYSVNKLNCPVIKTKLGNISGIREQTVLGNSSLCAYRGIRYGEPPVGKLRFKVSIDFLL